MSLKRELLPDVESYFESLGLRLLGNLNSTWKTTRCNFHGGSDSMRINIVHGWWKCMSCEAKGGDLISYHSQAFNMEFVDTCKALGVWEENSKPLNVKQKTFPLRAALEVVHFESNLIVIAALNISNGANLTADDRERLKLSAARINKIYQEFT